MHKKYIILGFLILLCFTHISAQEKPFSFKDKSNKKENTKKDEYKYKINFYNALKEKSRSNFDESIKYFEKCIKINSAEASPYYHISKVYYLLEEYEKSLEYSKKASELDMENKWYVELYAENLFNNSEFSEAVKLFKKLIKKDKNNVNYYINLASAYIYAGKLKNAIKTYNELEKINGISHFSSVQKHKIYLELKDFDSASKELEELIEKFPEHIEAYEMLSDCYILNNDFDNAFEVLKTLSMIDKSSGAVHLTLSDFYLKKEDTLKYLEELSLAFSSKKLDPQTKIKKFYPILESITTTNRYNFSEVLNLSKTLVDAHPKHEIANYIYADLLKSNGDFETAFLYYEKVLEINKNQKEAWIEMLFLSLQKKKYIKVITDSEKALELFPTNPTLYYLNALGHYNTQDYIKAIESVNTGVNFVVDNNTLSSEMYSLLGNLYNENLDHSNSDKAYEIALEFFPENVIVLNNYAYYLSLREENLEKAEEMSRQTIELFPEEGNYYDTYAWILYKMKNYFEAKKYMLLAIEKGEGSSHVVMEHMSKILFELGEMEEYEKYKKKSEELKMNISNNKNEN